MTINGSGIGIVMLGVANLDRAVAFYRDRLGFGVKFQTPGFAFLDAGPVTLALSEPLGRAVATMTGAMELVLPVANVAEAHRLLLEKGVAFTQAPRAVTPTDWAANFNDPDGHRLSIFGPQGS
jgi:catechol 2,3-dioxygenase-like lactoylglutathione lyase family enzyme